MTTRSNKIVTIIDGVEVPQRRRRAGPEPTTLTMAERSAIRELAAKQHSQRTIAGRLGISYGTFRKALDRDPKARSAWEDGLAEERLTIEQALMKQATDTGSPRSIQAAQLLLRARHGLDDATARGPLVSITLPAPMDARAYKKALKDITPCPGAMIDMIPNAGPPTKETDPIKRVIAKERETRHE